MNGDPVEVESISRGPRTLSKGRKQALIKAAGRKCSICKATKYPIHIHHRDSDRTNNSDENLQVVCQPCHWEIHRGHQWSEELGDWDTPMNREAAARRRRWDRCDKRAVVMLIDADVLEFLRSVAKSEFGTEEVGRVVSDRHYRNSPTRWLNEEQAA